MIELLQHMPRHVATSGRYAREYFTREGRLRHIHRLHYWPLDRVLREKYKLPEEEVRPWVGGSLGWSFGG
jgi:serine/threonine-protein kinase SRPK3